MADEFKVWQWHELMVMWAQQRSAPTGLRNWETNTIQDGEVATNLIGQR